MRSAFPYGTPTLLPDPAAVIEQMRAWYARRRAMRAGYPVTNHADVRYATNYVSIALANDLIHLEPSSVTLVWTHWRAASDMIITQLRGGDHDDEYPDNAGFWTRQLPALADLLDDARDGGLRNARLSFRHVGKAGTRYPPWVADLKGRSGVYVIRAPGGSGALETVYVGSSSTDRLHGTLTRHFQRWRRWKKFWRGGFTEGHDPGLTYDRNTAEAAVILTPPQHALELESRLIRRLRPRDNLIGQPRETEVPF